MDSGSGTVFKDDGTFPFSTNLPDGSYYNELVGDYFRRLEEAVILQLTRAIGLQAAVIAAHGIPE